MSKFSVVVPVYNVENYLDRCVESLIKQTLNDIEIILVDDGSPDNCGKMCDEYAKKDSRVVVIHKKNGGVSAARNDGILKATGEWIIFCDSDDWMETDALEKMYNAGTSNNADVVLADVYLIRGDERKYNKYYKDEFTTSDRAVIEKLVAGNLYASYAPNLPEKTAICYGGPWNKAVRRKILIDNDIKFDLTVKGIFDDVLYSAYILAQAKCVTYVSHPVYNYIRLETSLTHTFKPAAIEMNENILLSFEQLLKKYRLTEKLKDPMNALTVRRLSEIMPVYFFSKKNKNSFFDNQKELKEILSSDRYFSAAQNVELDKLLKSHKRVAKITKKKSAFSLWVLYKLKAIKQKLK